MSGLVEEAQELLFSLADKVDYSVVSLTAASTRRLCRGLIDLRDEVTSLEARLAERDAEVARLREAAQALVDWPMGGPEPSRLWNNLQNALKDTRHD